VSRSYKELLSSYVEMAIINLYSLHFRWVPSKKSGTDPGLICDGSTIRIRHNVVFLFLAIWEQYVHTIYSGSVRRHYLRMYYVLSYTTHWICHGSTRIRLVQGGIPKLSILARFYCRDPPLLHYHN